MSESRILGAVLAGGRSRRFGRDKAVAELGSMTLIKHVIAGLASQCDRVIVCGRECAGHESVADTPGPGLGPLGGLCSALEYAQSRGFGGVLSAGCDVLPVPELGRLTGAGPAFLLNQPLFAYWPAELACRLRDHLASQDDLSVYGWVRAMGARQVRHDFELFNINTPDELARYARSRSEVVT